MTETTITICNQSEDDVVGFAPMSCETATGLARVYLTNAAIMGALGSPVSQAYWAGQAMGVTNGACGPV